MKDNITIANLLIAALLFCTGCNSSDSNKQADKNVGKDTSAATGPAVVAPKRAPIINIGDTLSVKRIVLTIKDSASTTERISMKLAEIYGVKLADAIQKNGLKVTGPPMAWYKSQKAPYFFEAGIPVDKKPARKITGIQVKETGMDSIIVAHFYGPYELTNQAYDVIKEMLKERKKSLKGAPYEIYVEDPVDSNGRPRDPYKVQTDIVFPYK